MKKSLLVLTIIVFYLQTAFSKTNIAYQASIQNFSNCNIQILVDNNDQTYDYANSGSTFIFNFFNGQIISGIKIISGSSLQGAVNFPGGGIPLPVNAEYTFETPSALSFIEINLYNSDYICEIQIFTNDGEQPTWIKSGSSIHYNEGYVGIGIDEPTHTFDVNGDINFNGDLYKNGVLFTTGGSSSWIKDASNNVYYTGGKIGIGTPTPQTLLNVNVGSGGTNGIAGIRVGGLNNYESMEFGIDGDYDGMIRSFGNNLNYYAGHWKTRGTAATENHSHNWYTSKAGSADWSTVKMILNQDGYLGIGTTNPGSKLVIAEGNNGISLAPGVINSFGFNRNVSNGVIYNTSISAWQFTARNEMFTLEGYNGVSSNLLTVLKNGNVGIGTINPQNALDVNGTIRAKEVKVSTTGWSDFVFAPAYKLKTLAEVEQYIKINGHLENIPSAKNVEENGVDVGEMQKKLLEKVEELTLYVIELKKENQQFKEEINNIKQKTIK